MELEYGGRRYSVAGGELTLGADPGATVVLAGTRAHHAVVRALGERMATIRAAEAGAEISVNGVALGPDPTPLLDGDTILIGTHQLKVVNPSHPPGGPGAPPPGARERLHDTLFGLPRSTPVPGTPAAPPPPKPQAIGGRLWIVVAAVVSLALLGWLLLR
ncbi:MAG TPA: FHA domain-containing protein [Gemmatimonadales bacterium]